MKPHSRTLAAFLALALVTVSVPLAPSAGAQSGECEQQIHEGWIAFSNPGSSENVRVSQSVYLYALGNPGLGDEHSFVSDATGVSARDAANGLDAYVVDLQCLLSGSESFCIKRLAVDPTQGNQVPLLFSQPTGEPPNIHVQFFDDSPVPSPTSSWNPDVPPREDAGRADSERVCNPSPADGDSRYAVVYVTSGVPIGLQNDEGVTPFTSHFQLEMYII